MEYMTTSKGPLEANNSERIPYFSSPIIPCRWPVACLVNSVILCPFEDSDFFIFHLAWMIKQDLRFVGEKS